MVEHPEFESANNHTIGGSGTVDALKFLRSCFTFQVLAALRAFSKGVLRTTAIRAKEVSYGTWKNQTCNPTITMFAL